VVIEAKRPESNNNSKAMVQEGISQHLRNQRHDEIPNLFAYAQLLLSISQVDGRFGTTNTAAKFWARWREEEFSDAQMAVIKNKPLDAKANAELFEDKPAKLREYFESLWSQPMLPSDQDRLLISLLTPARLLELLRGFVLFDRKVGKIVARYQQFFGIRALLARINQVRPNGGPDGGGRQGGVLWHTTGSGKSFTMVFLTKALLLQDALKECRIVVVTDRIDLEVQLAQNFITSGAFGSMIATKKEAERSKATSGRDLAKRISSGNERILFTLVHKFNTASKLPECRNDSRDLIVLVDEGHRSHGGETHERMKKALPRAAYVAFTGTPLLKDEKTSNKFGPIVHAYTMQRAVEDGTVTPLLYEERVPELAINEQAVNRWFEKITAGLSDKQKSDLKRKFDRKGAIYGAANRIELIAWDIATHFSENIKKLDMGLKGQVATDRKTDAIRYKQALDETGLVTSAVVISAPDTREGNTEVDEEKQPEVQKWWKQNIGNDAEGYEKRVLLDFGTDGAPDLLIVVDKLLTGFDEPRNTVLYIDKKLEGHNLIQAIARVNRLHDAKRYGVLVDYRGILKELDTAIRAYQDLANNTQGGFDIADIEGLYSQFSTEYKRLPSLHDSLWSFFAGVTNRKDTEQYRQVLMPKLITDAEGESHDTRQKLRDDFSAALTEFGLCLQTALSSRSFFEDRGFSEELIARYKEDLRFFTSLRKIARQDAMETVDYSTYEEQIRRLVDKQVIGREVREPEGVYLVHQLGKTEETSGWSEEKTRNETDLIRTRLRKTIEQELAEDPYAQKVFAELLKHAIAEAEAMFDHPLQQYALFKNFEEKLEARATPGVPDAFGDNRHAQAYYGAIKLALGEETFAGMDSAAQQRTVAQAFETDLIVRNAVAENSLNPQNIEASIRKGLLPKLFSMVGLEKAKLIVEQVIQITRLGLSRE
jgi:type I restriction enzyme, R subunit